MGILYECGAGLVHTQFARSNFNMDAYVFSSGPSLSSVDLNLFNGAPVFKVGINTTYPKVKPDMWIGMDIPKCFNSNLWTEPFPKILRYPFAHNNINEKSHNKVKDFPLVYFAKIDDKNTPRAHTEIFKRRSHKVNFIWTNNTLTTTLHILIWMGFKRIHLLGSDFGGDGEKDYFDDSENARPFNHDKSSPSGKISKKQNAENQILYRQQIQFLRNFVEIGEKRGVELISCSKVSPANSFLNFLTIEEALKRSKERANKSIES